ncbi:MAG: glutamate formimidoyltransferase [Deltaproteobacteria bacterium]|nr:glutamate formimidoyltransferase [Deltaproteobacteria bacterium]
MKEIIACVPNFSEGRDFEKIRKITDEIKKVKDLKLLDIASDKDHHRTVVTFVGGPSAIKTAAFASIARATELIDMSSHKGGHPRIGATDVFPFVPVRGVTMETCVQLARELGKEVGEKLGIPVYLYEEAANKPERKSLQVIRKGQYEALPTKLKQKQWEPDYGPAEFNPKSGATVIGARGYVIAFNVNLQSRAIALAKRIAEIIRESGSVEVNNNKTIRVPGVLNFVKAIGVDLKEYGLVQVSMNLTNYKVTPMHMAFETIKRLAGLSEIEIHSSEIVGLITEESLLMSGKFYSPRAYRKKSLITIAVEQMMLDKFEKFAPERKIIEWMI